MKIGIMTFHAASNHGAALQAYALQTQLQKMGHDPFFINYQFGQLKKGLLGWIGRTPANTFEKLDKQLRYRPFVPFQDKNLIVDPLPYFDHEQLKAKPPEADLYICGSDQIWNPKFLTQIKDEHAFWLDFGNNNIRRVAYAPSFGTAELSDDVCARYAVYAKRLDVVSVREKNGLELLEKLGRKDAFFVPDPTLLLEPNEYLQIESNHQESFTPYLFSYQLQIRSSPPSPAIQINNRVCSELGLDLYQSYSISFLYNIIHDRYLNPGQWLYKLHKSRFIVSNSFHATVFAILFHRPFITILRQGLSSGLNDRIESLLEFTGLQHRAVTKFDNHNIDKLCHEQIDWHKTDYKIKEFRMDGQKFLINALN